MSAVKDSGKTHRAECTGLALETAKKHAGKEDIVFFAACFCPYVQRIWVAFEYLGIPYQVSCISKEQFRIIYDLLSICYQYCKA